MEETQDQVLQTQDNLVKVDHLQVVLTDTKDGVDLVVLVDQVEHLEEVVDLVDGVEMVPLNRNLEIPGLVQVEVVEEAAVVLVALDMVTLEPIMQVNQEIRELLEGLVNLVLLGNQGKQEHQGVLEQLNLVLSQHQQVLSPLK